MDSSALDQEMAIAYALLSASAARNRLFCQKAKAEGDLSSARLLSALAEGEEIMARRALIYLRGKITALSDHMAELSRAKAWAGSEHFARLSKTASQGGQQGVADSYARFAAASLSHRALVDDPDTGQQPLFVCQVCGYVAAGAVPDKCPVCNAVAGKFSEHVI